MKLKHLIYFQTLIVIMGYFAGTCRVKAISGWSYIEAGSEAEKGLKRSLRLIPPGDPPLSAEEVRALAARAGDPKDHPEADVVILTSRDRTAFDAEGYYHLIQQEAVKLLNEKGVRDYGSFDLEYRLPYNRARILEAYILSPKGEITRIASEDILDVVDSSDAYSNIFEPIWRKKVVLFPEVTPGCTVCYTYEVCSIKPTTPGVLNWGHGFNGPDPCLSASCCLKGPSDVKLHWFVTNDPEHKVQFTQSVEGEYTIYCWKAQDMPMIIQEPGMIPMQELSTSLFVATDTWQSYSGRESSIIEPLLVPDDAIKQKVAELTRDLHDPRKKIFRLFQYVTKKVRYLGVAYGDRPGINPDPVTRTFKNNAGVCKDKAGLLTAMLRLAGIEAYYTLNNPTHRIFPQIAVDQFNHAIVSARLPGEKHFIYLDVTADLVRSMIPFYSGGMGVLRIMPEGCDIDFIPIAAPEENKGQTIARTTLDASGTLTGTIEFSGNGRWDWWYRTAFYYIKPQNRLQWLGHAIQDISPGAFITDYTFSPDPADNLEEPMRVELSFQVPDFLVKTGDYALFKMPCTSAPLDWIYKTLFRLASLPVRKYPLDLESTSYTITEETFQYPEKYRIKSMPQDVTVDTDELYFKQTYSDSGKMICFKRILIVKQVRVPPENYGQFRQAVDRIKRTGRAFIVLEAIQ